MKQINIFKYRLYSPQIKKGDFNSSITNSAYEFPHVRVGERLKASDFKKMEISGKFRRFLDTEHCAYSSL